MPLPSRHRWLEVEQIGEVTLVKFTRSSILEDDVIESMGEQLTQLVTNLGCRNIVLSFANVKRLASSLVGKLMGLHKKIQAAGGRMVVCNLDEPLHEIFETLKLPQVFKICRDEQDALQTF